VVYNKYRNQEIGVDRKIWMRLNYQHLKQKNAY
jgi:hypothetical protein